MPRKSEPGASNLVASLAYRFGRNLGLVLGEAFARGVISAHADQAELLGWLRRFRRPPRQTFVVHGEARASSALRDAIERELKWPATVAAAVPARNSRRLTVSMEDSS